MEKKTYKKPEAKLVDIGIRGDLLGVGEQPTWSAQPDNGTGTPGAKQYFFDDQDFDFLGGQDTEQDNSSETAFPQSF